MKLARKEPRPGAWHGGLWLQASKRCNGMESSGVPVVFETCETLMLLDRCPAFASFQKSHWNGMETRWKWEGARCSDTGKAREELQYKYIVLAKIHLDFDSWSWLQFFWWWTWLYVSVADRLVSSQVSHGVPSFLSTGACRSIESQQYDYEHRLERELHWQWRSQGLVLGMGVCGSRPRNGEIKWNQVVYQWCSRLVSLSYCWTGVEVFRCWACASFQRVIEIGWTQDESGTGEGVLTLVKLEKFHVQVPVVPHKAVAEVSRIENL